MSEARETAGRFVRALAARDLAAAMALSDQAAVWEVHVPGRDGQQVGLEEIADLMAPWFTDRDGFTVVRHRLVAQGDTVALQWELDWRDAASGAPCSSHQSHFFELDGGLILQHWLSCSGVRVFEPADAYEDLEAGAARA